MTASLQERARRRAANDNLLSRVACKGLAELCFHYLALHYNNTITDRRTASARLQEQRRRMQHMESGDIHATIMPQVDDDLANKLDRDNQSPGSMYDGEISVLGWIMWRGFEDHPGLGHAQ